MISAADKTNVYDDANPTFNGPICAIRRSSVVSLSFSTGADATSGVGSYNIVPHADGSLNVLVNSSDAATNGTLSGSTRTLMISAADKTKVYGDANPTFTGSISGGQNSDSVSLS